MFKRVASLAVCAALLLCSVPNAVGAADDTAVETATTDAVAVATYKGPYTKVGDAILPLAEHMPGTFFSKNGQACTNHATADCVASGDDCNCMRYYPTGDAYTCEVDLLAVQCFGFSRLVFYKCFGFLDHPINASRYHSVGYILNGWVTEESVKSLLMQAAPGAHVRLARGHSVSILSMDDEFITVYHGNSGGDNVATAPCIVSTKRFTWAAFAEYAVLGVEYVNMPNEYPGWEDVTDSMTGGENGGDGEGGTVTVEKETGYYITTDYLNLRAEPNTGCEVYLTIPVDTDIVITEVDGDWGKTSYDGYDGWVYLYYTAKTTVPYITTDYLNLRAEPNTDCDIHLTIPVDTVIEMEEISGDWGRTSYGGYEGWVYLQYAAPYVPVEAVLTPSSDMFRLGADGYLRATAWGMTYEDFTSHFEGQELSLISPKGNDISQGGYVTTDTTVQLMVNGAVAHEAKVCLAGDINCDGAVKAADYIILKRTFLGFSEISDAAFDACDVTGDKKLSAADYISVKRFCVTNDSDIFQKYKNK